MAKFDSNTAKAARAKSSANNKHPELKSIQHMQKHLAEGAWFDISRMSVEELEKLVANPQTPAYMAGLASYYLMWKKNGDPNSTKLYMERSAGKVPDRIIDETPEANKDAIVDEILEILNDKA